MAAQAAGSGGDRAAAILIAMHQGSGGRAQAIRQAAGLSVAAIAEACGQPAKVVYAWESGEATPLPGDGLAWLEALYAAAPLRPGAI